MAPVAHYFQYFLRWSTVRKYLDEYVSAAKGGRKSSNSTENDLCLRGCRYIRHAHEVTDHCKACNSSPGRETLASHCWPPYSSDPFSDVDTKPPCNRRNRDPVIMILDHRIVGINPRALSCRILGRLFSCQASAVDQRQEASKHRSTSSVHSPPLLQPLSYVSVNQSACSSDVERPSRPTTRCCRSRVIAQGQVCTYVTLIGPTDDPKGRRGQSNVHDGAVENCKMMR